jgi:4-hydroxybenzoate polyprenyltransferase
MTVPPVRASAPHPPHHAPTGAAAVLASLAAAAHLGPTVAVTLVAGLLGAADGLDAVPLATLVGAVLCGQLTIGWANDLLDLERDRTVGRTDKPLAAGLLPVRLVRGALGVAAVACVLLSLALGWRSGVVHLGLVVAMGQAYNLGLKATAWSWAPYAVAFGSLPAVAHLAGEPSQWPAWWLMAAGATLGVGAHLLNALPDLADDARTGVHGLPHRLGERRSRLLAAALLAAASALAALGPAGAPGPAAVAALALVAALVAVAALGSGKAPFRAAMLVAVVDVVLLVAAGR